jgi:hypothetical protein
LGAGHLASKKRQTRSAPHSSVSDLKAHQFFPRHGLGLRGQFLHIQDLNRPIREVHKRTKRAGLGPRPLEKALPLLRVPIAKLVACLQESATRLECEVGDAYKSRHLENIQELRDRTSRASLLMGSFRG